MFRIDKSPIPVDLGHIDRAVVDDERSAWMRMEQGTRGGATIFRLTWQHRVIPFAATLATVTNDNQEPYKIYEFESFGEVIFSDLPPYRFSDDAEAQMALLLAAEALIVFGGFYNGEKERDGVYRVRVRNQIVKKSDFNLA